MNSLFPIETNFPPGFSYFPDFLTIKEEEELYHEVLKLELHNMQFQGFEAKRKVASFGYDWSFEKRTLSKGKEIPASFSSLMNKVANHLSIDPADFAELLVTEYPIGSVINWHRDAPPFNLIAGISVISFPVKRRSLYTINGIARTDWQHSIAPVEQVRYSVTLRTLRS